MELKLEFAFAVSEPGMLIENLNGILSSLGEESYSGGKVETG